MIVMSLVFSGYTMGNTMYPVRFITGYTMWNVFSTSTTTSLTALEDNKYLLQKTKVPREVFIISRVYTSFINLLFSIIALLIVYIFFRVNLNWTVIIVFVDIFFELIFSMGISFILATIYVFYKDIRFIWSNFIVVLVHMVAIYIPLERYPESLHQITKINPMFFYPNIARQCVLEGSFNVDELKMMCICAVCSISLGIFVFKYKENEIVKKL